MLSPEAFEAWCRGIKISPYARALVDQIRTSAPARRVGGGRSNVSGRYLRLARVLNVPLADLLTGRAIPANIHSLRLVALPHWHNVWAPRPPTFNNKDAPRQMEAALKEVPPPSLMAFAKRHGYTHGILRKYFPDQCQAIQQRYREHYAACIEQRRAAIIEEFRRVALQLHDDGTELTLNRIFTRMSTTQGLRYAIARDLLAETRREIANRESKGKCALNHKVALREAKNGSEDRQNALHVTGWPAPINGRAEG
jgi:hypothetical protein